MELPSFLRKLSSSDLPPLPLTEEPATESVVYKQLLESLRLAAEIRAGKFNVTTCALFAQFVLSRYYFVDQQRLFIDLKLGGRGGNEESDDIHTAQFPRLNVINKELSKGRSTMLNLKFQESKDHYFIVWPISPKEEVNSEQVPSATSQTPTLQGEQLTNPSLFPSVMILDAAQEGEANTVENVGREMTKEDFISDMSKLFSEEAEEAKAACRRLFTHDFFEVVSQEENEKSKNTTTTSGTAAAIKRDQACQQSNDALSCRIVDGISGQLSPMYDEANFLLPAPEDLTGKKAQGKLVGELGASVPLSAQAKSKAVKPKAKVSSLGGGFVLVFALAEVYYDKSPARSTQADIETVAVTTGSSAAGAATSTAISGSVSNASVLGIGAASGALVTVLQTGWSLSKYYRGNADNSSVEVRRTFAQSSAGSLAGATAVAGVALCSGGWVPMLGAAIVGSYYGSLAGNHIDTKIWNAVEDLVSEVYFFFNLPQKRGSRPEYPFEKIKSESARVMLQPKKDQRKWESHCLERLQLLINIMYRDELDAILEATSG